MNIDIIIRILDIKLGLLNKEKFMFVEIKVTIKAVAKG
jgi:hypothetical protein